MKRIAFISVISITSILMLLLSAIPHHHHNGGFHCFKIDMVEHDCDDQHAQHHNPTTNHNSENSNCILHANFILQESETNIHIKSFYLNYNNENDFNGSYTLSAFRNINVLLTNKRIDISEYNYYLISTYIISPIGLRAPPTALV